MTEHVFTVQQDMQLRDLAHLMLRNRISGVPVVDDKEKVLGVVTATDLFRVLAQHVRDKQFGGYEAIFNGESITVGSIMVRDVVTFTPETPIEELIRTSIDKNIHLFPILVKGKLVGIVGKRDILNAGFSFI